MINSAAQVDGTPPGSTWAHPILIALSGPSAAANAATHEIIDVTSGEAQSGPFSG